MADENAGKMVIIGTKWKSSDIYELLKPQMSLNSFMKSKSKLWPVKLVKLSCKCGEPLHDGEAVCTQHMIEEWLDG